MPHLEDESVHVHGLRLVVLEVVEAHGQRREQLHRHLARANEYDIWKVRHMVTMVTGPQGDRDNRRQWLATVSTLFPTTHGPRRARRTRRGTDRGLDKGLEKGLDKGLDRTDLDEHGVHGGVQQCDRPERRVFQQGQRGGQRPRRPSGRPAQRRRRAAAAFDC